MSSDKSKITDGDIVTIRNTFITVAPKKQNLRRSQSDSDLSNTSNNSETEEAVVVGATQNTNHRVWGAVELSDTSGTPRSCEDASGIREERQNRQTYLDCVEICDMSSGDSHPVANRKSMTLESEHVRSTRGSQIPSERTSVVASPPSAAYLLHERGECIPCTRGKCSRGSDCKFCHYPHGSKPSKNDRMRYRKHFDRCKEQIIKSPEDFDLNTVELPPSIASNAALKNKFLGRLAVEKRKALAGRSGDERVLPATHFSL